MIQLLSLTAWPMRQPAMYSPFHLVMGILCLFLPYLLAKRLKNKNPKSVYRILFFCGLLLLASEIYKQLFLYYIVNGKVYDWWYFPFQLCSMPMYFCLLLPFISRKYLRRTFLTFMQDFNFLGGFLALAVPEGYLTPYWTLTLHGFFWHGIIIFIALLIAFTNEADPTAAGYGRSIPLFGLCCLAASIINIAAPVKGQADMFYISPYYPSVQTFFHWIGEHFGIFAGNMAYLLSICLGGFLLHVIFKRCFYSTIK